MACARVRHPPRDLSSPPLARCSLRLEAPLFSPHLSLSRLKPSTRALSTLKCALGPVAGELVSTLLRVARCKSTTLQAQPNRGFKSPGLPGSAWQGRCATGTGPLERASQAPAASRPRRGRRRRRRRRLRWSAPVKSCGRTRLTTPGLSIARRRGRGWIDRLTGNAAQTGGSGGGVGD
jgi:hypothetical protein